MQSDSTPRRYSKMHGEAVMQEWSRVCLFAEVIGRLEGVRTAKPLSADSQTGRIDYEWIPDLRPLLSIAPSDLEGALHEVGRMLANLHCVVSPQWDIEQEATHPLDRFGLEDADVDYLAGALPSGFFWGDCWHGNVLLGPGLVFLDPLPNRWLFDREYTRASGALDISMLYMSLFFCHPLRRLIGFDPRLHLDAARALLTSYLAVLGVPEAYPGVLRLSRQLAVRYISAFSHRLMWPIAAARQYASRRVLSALDRSTSWGKT